MMQLTPPRTPRFSRAIPVFYRVAGTGNWHRGVTISVSESGMLLGAPTPVPLRKRLELTFRINHPIGNLGPGETRVFGEVVRHGLPTPSVRYPIGVQFAPARRTDQVTVTRAGNVTDSRMPQGRQR